MSNNYLGTITLQITGLTNRETVTIEKFIDVSGSGLIDASAQFIQAFSLTDGSSNVIAGIRNINIPGDDDGTVNGQIRSAINFLATSETDRSAGNFLYRVTSPSSGTATNSFKIVQVPAAQRIIGTVLTNGVPVPGAFVALLSTNQNGKNFIGGAVADASGNYAITNAAGTFQILALKPGLIGNFSTSPIVTLNSNQTLTTNISLTVGGSRTISGKFADASNGSIGIPLGQVFMSSTNNDVTVGYTDNQGNFNFALTASLWKIEGGDAALAMFGYLRPQNKTKIDVTLGSVSGVVLSYTKGTALIYGSVKDDLNNPLVGVEMYGNDGIGQLQGWGITDTSGNYVVATSAGSWNVNPSNDDPQILGAIVTQNPSTNISSGQAIQENFVVKRATAQITGFVRDGSNTPITNLNVFANTTVNGTNMFNANATTDGNGNYSLPSFIGTWVVSLDSQGLSQRGFPSAPSTNVTVSGTSATANFIVRSATTHLRGRVINNSGATLTNVFVFGFISGVGGSSQSVTDSSGNFDLPVNGGIITVQLSGTDMASRNLIGPSIDLTVFDGFDQNGITLVAQAITRQISGSLRNYTNAPISGVNISGNYSVSGTNYSSSATTDGTGAFSFGAFVSSVNGVGSSWGVNVDNNGLSTRGFGAIATQYVDVGAGNATANLYAPIFTSFRFRIFTAPIGDFGGSDAPAVTFPVVYKNYRAALGSLDTNFPTADQVIFGGPNGSGISGMAADVNVSDPPNGFYSTAGVLNPNYPVGGPWNVIYKGALNTFNAPDPQIATRLVVPLPSVVVSNDVMRSVNWTYYNSNGTLFGGLPSFITFNLVEVFDQNLNFIYQSPPLTNANSFVFDQVLNWSQVGRVRMRYLDNLNNYYFIIFTKKIPAFSKTGARLQNNQFQFSLNGLAGQNYTVQSATNVATTNWTTLVVTNSAVSPFTIIDSNATNKEKFYRVLVGP